MSELTQNDKIKNSRFHNLKILWYKKFKALKIYLAYWGFAKCLLVHTTIDKGVGLLKTTKGEIRDFMI